MAGALFEMQRSYPTVSYLLLEGEPHSEDYASYETTINTHCVLFAVEQAGYLAGYAAVREGYTALGFVGADSMPETVRYCTGMMQGAEAAAEREGQQVRLEVWLVGSGAADDAVTRPHEQLVRRRRAAHCPGRRPSGRKLHRGRAGVGRPGAQRRVGRRGAGPFGAFQHAAQLLGRYPAQAV